MKKRIISLVIAVVLCMGMVFPATVNAAVDTTKPYLEKVMVVDGDIITLTITLRGAKAAASGQVDLKYPAEKLDYICPPLYEDEDGYMAEDYRDVDADWLANDIYSDDKVIGVINGHTMDDEFRTNFFGAYAIAPDRTVCIVQFKITNGPVSVSDFTYKDLISSTSGTEIVNPTDIIFTCNHTYVEDIEASVVPTCTNQGKLVEICSSCGDQKSTVIPVTDTHNYVEDDTNTVKPTETTPGKTVLVCSVCGDEKSETVPATGEVDDRPYLEKVFTKVGDKIVFTVTLKGPKAAAGGQVDVTYNTDKLSYICPPLDEDGIEDYGDVAWLAVTIGNINGHTNAGKFYANFFGATSFDSDQIVCRVEFQISEGAEITEEDIVIADEIIGSTSGINITKKSLPIYNIYCEHIEYAENTEEYVAHTCISEGQKVYYCVDCGDRKVETLYDGPHNYVKNDGKSVEPTCTEAGVIVETCSYCGDDISSEVAPLGHNLIIERIEATCTEKGSTTFICLCCDYESVQVIEAKGHNYNAVVTDPTCTEGGYTAYTCSECDDSYIANETAALGHEYITNTVAATCAEKGSTTITCSHCDYRVVTEIAPLGHTSGDWTVDDDSKYKECTVCHSVLEEVVIGDVTGDGVSNILDAVLVSRYSSNLVDTFTEAAYVAGNVNGDNIVNISDAVLIARLSAWLIDKFPIVQ